ncbi:MAG: hypothetical protein AAF828_01500 [Bacteroidota bacterium]
MRNKILFLTLGLLLFSSLNAQIRVHQIEDLPDGFIMLGTSNKNSKALLEANIIPINAITGLSATNVQGALAELQGDINAAGDGWGAESVVSDASLTGNGTSGTPLSIVQSSINTTQVNNDANFISTVTSDVTLTGNGAGTPLSVNASQLNTGDLNNDAAFISTVNSDASLTGNGAGTPLAVVQSAINSSQINNDAGFLTAEAQALGNSGNDITLTGGSVADRTDAYIINTFTATGGETSFSFTGGTPEGGSKLLLVWRNGVKQKVGTDITISGSTATITGTPAEAGEEFDYQFIAQ